MSSGRYDLFVRGGSQQAVAMQTDAARVYVQGAALQEYSLACLSRGSVFSNRSAGKMVALTFDDGPFASKTPKILEILQQMIAGQRFLAWENMSAIIQSWLSRFWRQVVSWAATLGFTASKPACLPRSGRRILPEWPKPLKKPLAARLIFSGSLWGD